MLPMPASSFPSSSTWAVTDGFDIVTIGIKHKRTVIVRMIMRPQTRRTIILAACRQCRAVEGVHAGTVFRNNCDVNRPFQFAFTCEPEIGLPVSAETCHGETGFGLIRGHFHDQRVAK